MTDKAALLKTVGNAGELSVCLALLLAMVDATPEEVTRISKPIFEAFARSHLLDFPDVAELVHSVLGLLAKEPWTYIALCPKGWTEGGNYPAVGRKLVMQAASNAELRRILEEGLAAYSFDHEQITGAS